MSVKNSLLITGASQQNMTVVSNLNSVGSATAIQTNVANASSVSGNLAQSNVATVINGF